MTLSPDDTNELREQVWAKSRINVTEILKGDEEVDMSMVPVAIGDDLLLTVREIVAKRPSEGMVRLEASLAREYHHT